MTQATIQADPRTDGLDAEDAALVSRILNIAASGSADPLASWLVEVPDLEDRPAALDAAIRVSLGGSGATADEQRASAADLKARHPGLGLEIDRAVWLNRLIDPMMPSDDPDGLGPAPAIAEVGPAMADGGRRYRLERQLGSGSNGWVYLADDRLLSSEGGSARVAVKLLGRRGGERAIVEARRMRLVEHRNVVRVSDVGRADDGTPYIVQEYVRGENLEDWLSRQPSREPEVIVRLVAEIAEGVQAIHAAGLVHHDLKPQNVLIGGDGAVKVADFGSSSGLGVVRPADEDTDAIGSGGGTLAFLAPERLRLRGVAPMPCSDVFSLGAVLCWALTGRPVAGERPAEAIAALADPASDGSVVSALDPRLRKAGLDHDLRRIIARAVSFRIETRHESAGRLAQDLRDWLARRPIEWTEPGPVRRSCLLVRRRPVVLACLMAALVSLGAAGFWARAAQQRGVAARESALEAELESERAEHNRAMLDAERAWKLTAAQSLRRLLGKFATAKMRGLDAEVLTSLWILEWSHGPSLLDDPGMLATLWNERISVLEGLRASLHDSGQGGSIGARLLEPSLALWYLRASRPGDALELLDASMPAWERLCAPGDPWLEQVRALRAAAVVRAASGAEATGRDLPDGAADAAIQTLRGYEAEPPGFFEAPVMDLIRETLGEAGGAG